MVAAKRKAITGMPKQQYNYKRLQNKELRLLQLLRQPNLSLSYLYLCSNISNSFWSSGVIGLSDLVALESIKSS